MIEELRIRSLGVIDEAAVVLGPGLTVLSGETGAGKTMVLSGLSLVMGGRADPGMVRRDAERADVDGRWILAPERGAAIVAAVEEAGGDVESSDEGIELVLARSVSSSGRSRAFAGGRTVPASVLGDLTESLITVHGQADQLRLRDPRSQRDLLDRFAGPAAIDARARCGALLAALREAQRDRTRLLEQRQDREREAVLLRHGIAEIEAVAPEPGEDEALKLQASLLAHVTDLMAEMGTVHSLLQSDGAGTEGARELLTSAARHLERAATLDPAVASMVENLRGVLGELDLLVGEVSHYASGLDADPESLARIEERRHRLSELKKRYGPELEDVLSWRQTAESTVSDVDSTEERLAELDGTIAHLATELREAAAALTAMRRAAGTRFAAAVSAELQELAMPDAVLTVDVVTTEDLDSFGASGADTVTMLLAPHAGSDPRPLGAGASGGELSRVMLAIEVVLTKVGDTPTFVFDEVDAGIGGRVAVEVGRRLARLARSAQVIVVTHLPQVAAFADTHIVVSKGSSGQVTSSSVVSVTGEERVLELVRMLSGLEGSASGAEHASELLQLAEAERARDRPRSRR